MKIIMNMMQGCPTRCQTWPADHTRWGYIGIAFPVNDQCLTQTQQDYILQFVDCIDSLLDALLSQEDFPNEHLTCSHCSGHQWAVWRCQDCSLATPMCQKCMCHTHQENPFHRVQHWTGTHFRAAKLWEVGTYILVPHYAGQWVCDTLAICYVSVPHVNSVSVSVYHVTICQQTPFWDARQLLTILSLSLCSLRHSSEIPRATLESYLMSLLFGHHQWISTRTLYSSFQPST